LKICAWVVPHRLKSPFSSDKNRKPGCFYYLYISPDTIKSIGIITQNITMEMQKDDQGKKRKADEPCFLYRLRYDLIDSGVVYVLNYCQSKYPVGSPKKWLFHVISFKGVELLQRSSPLFYCLLGKEVSNAAFRVLSCSHSSKCLSNGIMRMRPLEKSVMSLITGR
jgi:hypothetical protein